MESQRQTLGRKGEELAAEHLVKCGWEILDRNWRCREGEIDIVARDPEAQAIVVVEVKTRAGTGYGRPLDTITYKKACKLRQLAAIYMRSTGRRARELRVDGIGVLWTRDECTIEHARRIDQW